MTFVSVLVSLLDAALVLWALTSTSALLALAWVAGASFLHAESEADVLYVGVPLTIATISAWLVIWARDGVDVASAGRGMIIYLVAALGARAVLIARRRTHHSRGRVLGENAVAITSRGTR